MGVLVLTDNPRNGTVLKCSLGEDIIVRDVPLPLYTLTRAEISLTTTGYPKLSAVSKHIAELRKLASRYDTVFVVFPPVPFWHDVAWSVKKALSGIPLQLFFFFPSDLVYGLDVDPLLEPPSSCNSILYACDYLIESDVQSLMRTYFMCPKPMYRRFVLCVLGVLARLYEQVSSGVTPHFSVSLKNTFSDKDLIECSSVPSIDSAIIESRAVQRSLITVSPPDVLNSANIVADIIQDTKVPILNVGKSLDILYSLGCLSCYEVDSLVPSAVHTWAVSTLVDIYDIDVNNITLGPCTACVYVTGKELPSGCSDSVIQIYAYLVRRTLQSYCSSLQKERITTDLILSMCDKSVALSISTIDGAPGDWWMLSDTDEALNIRVPPNWENLPVQVKYCPHFTISYSDIFKALSSYDIPSREILTALYYLDKCGAIFVDRDISLSVFGYLYYSLISQSSLCFDKSLDLLSLHILVKSCTDVSVLLAQVSVIFHDVLPIELSALIPSSSSGIDIDPITMCLHSESGTFGMALYAGQVVPIKTGVLVDFLCPVCGSKKALTVLSVNFSTVCKCVKCSFMQPISLLPILSSEENNAT